MDILKQYNISKATFRILNFFLPVSKEKMAKDVFFVCDFLEILIFGDKFPF